MLTAIQSIAIAPQVVDELTHASAELAAHLKDLVNQAAPKKIIKKTIRWMKREVAELHREYGPLINKAAFGQRWSDMNKFWLDKSLRQIQQVLDLCPKGWKWEAVEESRHITTWRCGGKVWTTFIRCSTEQQANKLWYSLYKPGWYGMAVVRKCETSEYWEVKVWNIDADVLAKLIRKDTPMAQLQYTLLESTNLDEKWAIYKPLEDGQRQYLGSVRRGFSGQWSHSLQPKYGQRIPTWGTKEEAAADLEKVFKRQALSAEQARASIFSF